MSNYKDFTSLPPEKEQQFVVFERTSVESMQKAKKIAAVVAGIFGVIVCIIVFSFNKPKNIMAEDDKKGDLEQSSETEDSAKEAAPTPEKPAEEAAKPDEKPAEEAAAKADGEADGDEKSE